MTSNLIVDKASILFFVGVAFSVNSWTIYFRVPGAFAGHPAEGVTIRWRQVLRSPVLRLLDFLQRHRRCRLVLWSSGREYPKESRGILRGSVCLSLSSRIHHLWTAGGLEAPRKMCFSTLRAAAGCWLQGSNVTSFPNISAISGPKLCSEAEKASRYVAWPPSVSWEVLQALRKILATTASWSLSPQDLHHEVVGGFG